MSKADLYRTRMEADRLLDSSKMKSQVNANQNAVKIHRGNTLEHELAKFFLAYELEINEKEYVTEAIFETGDRADVFCKDELIALEVTKSEKEKSILEKRERYPCEISVFDADEVIEIWVKKLKYVRELREEIQRLSEKLREQKKR